MPYTYKYPRPAVTTDCIVLHNHQGTVEILLVQRKNPPYQNLWALPGGFVEMDEPLEAAAKRELKEETNLGEVDLQQFRAYGDPGRDPRGRTISVVHFGWVAEKAPKIQAGDDAANAGWFALDHLPPLAFDHAKIIEDAKAALLFKRA